MKKIGLSIFFLLLTIALTLIFKSKETRFATNNEVKILKKIDSVKIEIRDDNFKISLGKKRLVSNDKVEIENFIKSNLKNMRNSKIYIIGNSETTFSKAKPIFDVLKKYDFMNFKLVTN